MSSNKNELAYVKIGFGDCLFLIVKIFSTGAKIVFSLIKVTSVTIDSP
jgi:hypothetical protein